MTDPVSRRPRQAPTTTSSDEARAAAKGGGSTPSATATPRRLAAAEDARAGAAGTDQPPTGTTTPQASSKDADGAADSKPPVAREERSEGSGRRVRVRRPDLEPVPTRSQGGAELDDTARDLARTALDTRGGRALVPFDDRRWDPDSDDLTEARNAHHSNTPEEMRDALGRDFNWLEGDLRVDDEGTLVMAHDAGDEGEGLTFDEWLTIGAAGERGLKIDVKEDEALPELLDALEESDIPDGRLMINVQASQVDEDAVRDMRERFPDAWLALNPRIREGQGYADEDLEEITDLADEAGGRVTFPIRWDIASDHAIETLKPHGRVSIWTADSQGTPDDMHGETVELRERGVDGVIDLGEPLSTWQQVQKRFVDIWESDVVRGGRELASDGWDIAGDLWDIGTDLARGPFGIPDLPGDVVDLGGDLLDAGGDALDLGGDIVGGIASHIPGL